VHGWRERIGAGLLGLACFVTVLIGAPAHAYLCNAGSTSTIEVSHPVWPDEAKLTLIDERFEVECADRPVGDFGINQICRWRARFVYAGTSGSAVDGKLQLPAHEIERIRLYIDGREVAAKPFTHNYRHFIELHADDAGHVEIEVELEIDVDTYEGGDCVWRAGFARHRLVARERRVVEFIVDDHLWPELPPLRARLEARAPRGWRARTRDEARESWPHGLASKVESPALVHVQLDNRPLGHGPFIAVGVGFGPQVRARLRAGYEVAAPPFLLYSLAIEGDAVEELMLIPAIEVASPVLLTLIPSAGIGVGVPVMLLPDTRAGVRTQLSLMWPFVGLIGSVDVYGGPLTPTVRGALMLQVSL
jgi:hypothetical protein